MTDINIDVFYNEFKNHIENTSKQHIESNNRMGRIELELKGKIGQKAFLAIIGFMVTLTLSLYGFLISQNFMILDKQGVMEKNIAEVKGRLDPYDIEFKH